MIKKYIFKSEVRTLVPWNLGLFLCTHCQKWSLEFLTTDVCTAHKMKYLAFDIHNQLHLYFILSSCVLSFQTCGFIFIMLG